MRTMGADTRPEQINQQLLEHRDSCTESEIRPRGILD